MTVGLAGRAGAYSGDGKGQTPTPVTIARRTNKRASRPVPQHLHRAGRPDTGSQPTDSLLPAITALPPIDRLPGDPHLLVTDSARPDALRQFVEDRTRRWGTEPVPVPGVIACILWTVIMADVVVGGWLVAVWSGAAPCSGALCSVATLGDHPNLLLALCATAVVTLAVSAVATRGLSQAGAAPLACLLVGGVVGVVPLLGIVAIFVASALCLAVLATLLVVVIDRI
jgi:hypothetical protein